MLNKIALKIWKNCNYLPIAVAVVAGVSGWVVLEYGIYTEYISEVTLINPMHYIVSLFLHKDWSQYVTSMYFFVPVGVFLTLMTDNKNVVGVILVSHVFAVLLGGMVFSLEVAGTTAAAYGLLAAAIVRATKIGTEDYSPVTQRGAPVAVLFIATLGLFMVQTASSSGFSYTPYMIGFVFGGFFEGVRAFAETSGVSNADEESKSRYRYFHDR